MDSMRKLLELFLALMLVCPFSVIEAHAGDSGQVSQVYLYPAHVELANGVAFKLHAYTMPDDADASFLCPPLDR